MYFHICSISVHNVVRNTVLDPWQHPKMRLFRFRLHWISKEKSSEDVTNRAGYEVNQPVKHGVQGRHSRCANATNTWIFFYTRNVIGNINHARTYQCNPSNIWEYGQRRSKSTKQSHFPQYFSNPHLQNNSHSSSLPPHPPPVSRRGNGFCITNSRGWQFMLPKKNKLRPYLALLRLNCKKIKPLEASYKPIFFVLRSKSKNHSPPDSSKLDSQRTMITKTGYSSGQLSKETTQLGTYAC